MASRVRPLNQVNFTGGLNLRGDAFELGEGESPDMLNVSVDPRGGFVARRGWTRWNDAAVDATWDPRTMFVHELSNGVDRVWLANNDLLSYTATGVTPWTTLQAAAVDVVASAAPHGADFVAWGDELYIATGLANPACHVDSALSATLLTQAEAATFTDYVSPSTDVFPYCDYVASFNGHVFAASIEEDTETRRSRLRWSHPNNPGAWNADDFWDFEEGGGIITGLVPMRDHLLIFKQSQVWALFGESSADFTVTNVAREKGAPHRQAIARSESAVFFYSHLEGVFFIADAQYPKEISLSIRPMFESTDFNPTVVDNIWLGWVNQKLWFGVPYSATASATDSTVCFVWDPNIGEGAWMAFLAADGGGIGPFAQGGFGGGSGLRLAAHRTQANVLLLDDNVSPLDDLDGTPAGFESWFVTKWQEGGMPTLKKAWRRPDLVMKERDQAYSVTITVYRDYNESEAARYKVVNVDAGGSGAVWGDFLWGDGTLWGPASKGSTIERAGNLGPAKAVQLKLTGEVGKPWGVDAIIFKYIPRRLR